MMSVPAWFIFNFQNSCHMCVHYKRWVHFATLHRLHRQQQTYYLYSISTIPTQKKTMGVVCVYAFPVPEGKSGQQVVDSLQKQVELLGGVKTGNFSVDCETYQANTQSATSQRLIHVLHNSEQPASCFSVLDTGTTLIADVLFDVLIHKLTSGKAGKEAFYQQRKGSKMESKGPRYELSDFIIKIGSVSMASNFKGILVEVEYCPCSVPTECWDLMRELMQSFMGNTAETPPTQVKNKMDNFYLPGDTVNQYLEQFSNFRKQTVVGQPIR